MVSFKEVCLRHFVIVMPTRALIRIDDQPERVLEHGQQSAGNAMHTANVPPSPHEALATANLFKNIGAANVYPFDPMAARS